MKYLIFIFLLTLPVLLFSQNQYTFKMSNNYEGKALTDSQIEELVQKELAHFDSIKTNKGQKVIRIEDLKGDLLKYKETYNSTLENVNYKSKFLINSFNIGLIDKNSLIVQIRSIDDYSKKTLFRNLTQIPIQQIFGDKEFIDKVISIYAESAKSEDEKNEFELYLKSLQRYPQYKDLIEETVYNFDYNKKNKLSLGYLLSLYGIENNFNDTYKVTQFVINHIKHNTTYGFIYYDDIQINVFDRLFVKANNKEEKEATINLLFQYLEKAPLSEIYNNDEIIHNNISEHFKQLVENKLYQSRKYKEIGMSKESAKNYFLELYLSHYARNLGFDAFPKLDSLLSLPEEIKQYDTNNINYSIADYHYKNEMFYGLKALFELVKYNKLSNSQKSIILNKLKEYKLQNSLSCKLPQNQDSLKVDK